MESSVFSIMKTNESERAQGVTEVLGKRRLDGYHGDFHGASSKESASAGDIRDVGLIPE